MNIFQLLQPSLNEAKVLEIAEQIAARSRTAVWDRVAHRIFTMSSNEARGYVRARAAAVVHEQVALSWQQNPSSDETTHRRLIELTTAAVVHLVLAQAKASRHLMFSQRRAA